MPAYDTGYTPQVVLGASMLSSRLKIWGNLLLINKLNVHQRRVWLVNDAPRNAVASGEFIPYISDTVNLAFLHQLLLSDRATRDLMSISSGSSNSQKRITPHDLLNYQVIFPTSKEEQTLIGKLLDKFDSLTAIHQRKLDHLKLLKKFLLQKMFI